MSRLAARSALLAALAVSAFPVGLDAQPEPVGRERHVLVIHYVDGRVTDQPLRRNAGSMWTPLFPRINGVNTSRDGLALTALQLDYRWSGRVVSAAVSLVYGQPHQARVPVATVEVRDDATVEVRELRAFGVEPITLTVEERLDATITYQPLVVCASPALEVGVDALSPDAPAYRVTVVNHSARGLMAFDYSGYRATGGPIVGRRKDARNLPIAPPEGKVSFELTLAGGTSVRTGERLPPQPLDRVEITSVSWEDGTVEGDPEPAAKERVMAVGAAQQLSRAMAALARAAAAGQAQGPRDLGTALERLPIEVTPAMEEAAGAARGEAAVLPTVTERQMIQLGLQLTKESVLADLAAFERGPATDAREWSAWLGRTIAGYQQWLARVNAAARPPARRP